MCLYPKLLYNKKYTKTKKNGGIVPPIPDERVTRVPIGCGKCMECRKQKARGWQVRLQEDIKENKNGIFVTLTFSSEQYVELGEYILNKTNLTGYDLDNEIATLATRRFLERWRKIYKKSLRHWLVTELGQTSTEHLHLHGILWPKDNGSNKTPEEIIEDISRLWGYGYVWPTKENVKKNYVSERTVNYIIKYIMKADELHKEYNSIVLTSPGIGSAYTKSYNATKNIYDPKNIANTNESYRTNSGTRIAMPSYWRNKIYSEKEREQLWLHKLDQQVRYVCGEKIDISKGEEAYYRLLEYHRRINKQLGYGDEEDTWERRIYEMQRRVLKQAARGLRREG